VPDVGPRGHQLAAAVAVDAFVLQTVLVPAMMYVCGRANCWLPAGWTAACRTWPSSRLRRSRPPACPSGPRLTA